MTEKEPQKTVARLKRKRKNRSFLNYTLLFLCIFTICVFAFLSGIKSYTPVADVEIGNNESTTMHDEDIDIQIKSVDERLKWIKMEDELPTVAVRESLEDKVEKATTDTKQKDVKEEKTEEEQNTPAKKTEKKTVAAPKPTIKEISTEKTDFRTAELPKAVIPLPTKTPEATKVYLGNFYSLEDAMIIQKRVNSDFPDCSAFIKATNDHYMVQLGSFNDKDKANSFIQQLKDKGYNPKTL